VNHQQGFERISTLGPMPQDALPLPPRDLIYVGSPDLYVQVGEEFLDHLIDLAALTSESNVLDIGSGIGRIASPLTGYLSSSAHYEGVDIVEAGVTWCQENITPRFPNFRFTLLDIHNSKYNLEGKSQAENLTLPFQDNAFDVVFLVSVFTHMLPLAVQHYLHEVARVLSPGGRLFSTFLLVNEEAWSLIDAGKSGKLSFKHQLERCYAQSANVPEAVVAYDERTVAAMLEEAGLTTVEGSPHYGRWCGRTDFASFQDIWVAHETNGSA
jgi:SAM-dependent methyltransferase